MLPLPLLLGFLNPMKIIPFVIQNWKPILIGGMAATIFYQNFMDTEWLKWVGVRTIPGIERELLVKVEQLEACEESRELLKSEIESVNSQVDKWASVSKKLQSSHDELVKELSEMRQKSQQAVQDILDGETPENCEAAMEYLKDAAQGDLKWQSE